MLEHAREQHSRQMMVPRAPPPHPPPHH